MHRKLAVTMILLFVLLSSAAALAAPAKYEFHLPCADPFWGEGGIWGMLFARSVEELTDGAVKIILHLGGQWGGSEEDYVRDVQLGALDMALTATSNLAPYTNSLYLYDVPFLFKDPSHQIVSTFETRTQLKPFVTDILPKASKECNFEILAVSPLGRRDTFGRRPLKSVDDLQGIKMRTMGSRPQIDAFKAVGTVVTPLPYGECYTGLQMGTIDAMENSPSIYYENRYYEVAPYWIGTMHYTITMAIIVQQNKWNSLPKQYQDIIRECAVSSAYIAAQWGHGASDLLLETVIPNVAKEVVHLSSEEQAALRAKALPVLLDSYADAIGIDVLKVLAEEDPLVADWLAKNR